MSTGTAIPPIGGTARSSQAESTQTTQTVTGGPQPVRQRRSVRRKTSLLSTLSEAERKAFLQDQLDNQAFVRQLACIKNGVSGPASHNKISDFDEPEQQEVEELAEETGMSETEVLRREELARRTAEIELKERILAEAEKQLASQAQAEEDRRKQAENPAVVATPPEDTGVSPEEAAAREDLARREGEAAAREQSLLAEQERQRKVDEAHQAELNRLQAEIDETARKAKEAEDARLQREADLAERQRQQELADAQKRADDADAARRKAEQDAADAQRRADEAANRPPPAPVPTPPPTNVRVDVDQGQGQGGDQPPAPAPNEQDASPEPAEESKLKKYGIPAALVAAALAAGIGGTMWATSGDDPGGGDNPVVNNGGDGGSNGGSTDNSGGSGGNTGGSTDNSGNPNGNSGNTGGSSHTHTDVRTDRETLTLLRSRGFDVPQTPLGEGLLRAFEKDPEFRKEIMRRAVQTLREQEAENGS